MIVQTPEYWKEEKFQPLIEETTAYGNKVLIPQSLQSTWKMWRGLQGKYPHDVERAIADGFFEQKPATKSRRIFKEFITNNITNKNITNDYIGQSIKCRRIRG